jgi:hypothetical protein
MPRRGLGPRARPRELTVSIVRVGLSETQKFADGYDAIFGGKKGGAKASKKPTASKSKPAPKSTGKPAAKKKPSKKK